MTILQRIARATCAAAACAVLAIPAAASAQPASAQPATPLVPFSPISWMLGKTWVADVTAPGGKQAHVESVVGKAAPDNRSAEFHVSFDGVAQYAGFYTWDPPTAHLAFAYASADGELTQGTAVPEGDGGVLQTFTIIHPDGKRDELRSHIKHSAPDAYDWNVEVPTSDGGWRVLITAHYTLKP